MKQYRNKEVSTVVITLANHANWLRLKCKVTGLSFIILQTYVTRTELLSSKRVSTILLCAAVLYNPQFLFSH